MSTSPLVLETLNNSKNTMNISIGNLPKNIDEIGDVGKYSSLALESKAIPHIAYYDQTNLDLKYTVYNGWEWNTTIVDSEDDVGMYSSMVLDSDALPHIAYQNTTSFDLKYAYFDGVNWTNITIDEAGDVGSYVSIAVSSNNNPHITYRDDTNEDLKYSYYNGTAWITMTLDGGTYNVGEYTSIVLDSSNMPHITYYNQTSADLMYMFFDGDNWKKTLVYGTNSVGKHTSIDLDSKGFPHISFFNQTSNDLMYSYLNNTEWVTETVDSEGLVGEYTSIAMGSNDEPHIVYNDASNSQLRYAIKDNGTWIFKAVDEEGDYASISIDANNNPHFSYYDTSDKNLRYLSLSGPSAVIVDSMMGQYRGGHSMQVDSNDVPHFAYENVNINNSGIKGVTYTTLNVTATLETGAEVWETQTVAIIGDGDASNAFGQGISLTLDSNDLPHLSYRNHSRIQYSHFDGNNWSHEIISDSQGSVISSIKTDSTDNPHIIYRMNNVLKYVFWNGTGWSTMSVGSQGNTWHAMNMDLALSDSDTPHICYWKSASSNMGKIAYAYYSGTEWVINNNVVSDGLPSISADTGRYCDIEVDHLGKPHIAHDYDSKLAYTKMNSTGDWNGWLVTEDWNVKHISLALDSLELPHISAYDSADNDMVYSWYDGENWRLRESGLYHTNHIYSSSDWGPYGEIDVDSNDKAHIAFIDWGPDNLIYYTDNFDANLFRDSDGDGASDAVDIFPSNPNENMDGDGDGVGDNSDEFPDDITEWVDSDGDGVGDNSDEFPDDITEWVDSDGDGVGDNSDEFPDDITEWVDSDGDGVGDNSDAFPNDPNKSVNNPTTNESSSDENDSINNTDQINGDEGDLIDGNDKIGSSSETTTLFGYKLELIAFVAGIIATLILILLVVMQLRVMSLKKQLIESKTISEKWLSMDFDGDGEISDKEFKAYKVIREDE